MSDEDPRSRDSREAQREIDRRRFLRSMGVVTVGGVLADLGLFDQMASGAGLGASAAGKPPNIVVLLVDELRFPTVFPDGIKTPEQFLRKFMPNLYHLWRHGVKFTNHHTAGNACSPARATIATGLYPHQEWLLATRTAAGPALQTAFPTYGKLLRSLGYQTPYIGKWHLSNPPSNGGIAGYLDDYGFAGMTTPDPTGTNGQGAADDPSIAGQAARWLERNSRSAQPYCLTVSFVNPHDKQFFWAGTEGNHYNALFAGNSVHPLIADYMSVNGEDTPPSLSYPVLPPNWESATDLKLHGKPSTHTLFRFFQQLVRGGAADSPPRPTGGLGAADIAAAAGQFVVAPSPIYPNLLGIGLAPFGYWQRGLDVYTYVMTAVDQEIGRVISHVPKDQLANTVFVMASDHGEYGGAHGMLSGKLGTAYDEAWHVPLIVADPSGRFTAHTDVPRDQLTSSADFMPLLVSLGNGGSRSWMTGDLARIYSERLDLIPLLSKPRAAGRDHLVFATDEIVPVTMNYLHAPTHVLGVQTPEAKLCTYSHWLPGTAVPARKGIELEFYDYNTSRGRAELVSHPHDPRARALLKKLLEQYVPQQMQAPLPTPALRRASRRARESYLAFVALSDAYFAKQLINEHQITKTFDYGLNM
jgi:arylsulfatase A-like enzyme